MFGLKFHDRTFQIISIIAILILGTLAGIYIGVYGFSPLIVAGSVAIVFVLITINRPFIAVSAFFLLIPLENLFVLQGSLSATSSKLMGAYLVFLLLITGSIKYLHEVFKNKKAFWLILLGLFATVSIIYSSNTAGTVNNLYRLALYIGLYFLMVMMIRDVKTLTYSIWALIIGGVLSVLSPIILGFGTVEGNLLERYGGLWGDQNEFAALLLIIIPLCYVVFLNSRGSLWRTLSGASFFVLLIGFFLTYSRGGFIAFMTLCLLVLFKIPKGKKRRRILIYTIPLIIAAFSVFYVTIADHYISRIDTLRTISNPESGSGDSSIGLRYYYYFEVAPKIFIENPFLGVGLGGFLDHNPHKKSAHNTFIEVLTGLGILGTIPFVMILYLTWKEFRAVQNATKRTESLSLLNSYSTALELGFLSLLVAGLFISLDLSKIFWLTIALASVLTNILMINTNPVYKRKNTVSGF